jgi:exodeoxyribonuclease VIII
MTPGIYYDLSNQDYHAGPGISKSGLDAIAKSPAHYYSRYLDPARPAAPEPTPSMKTGTLAHCVILESEQFENRYLVRPEGIDLRTKEGRAWAATIDPGLDVITAEQYARAIAQAESIKRLPDVAEAFANGRSEVSAFWTDKETGVLCKCRPDFVHDASADGVILFDLKTTQDASPAEFGRSVAKWRYHVQAAWYSDGYRQATGKDVIAYVFVAVENDWPHFCSAVMLDPLADAEGAALYRRNLNTYAECLQSGNWPGYSTAIETISLPAWAITQENAA